MSTLVVSNISDGTTTVGASYVTNGSPRALANFNGSSAALRDSLNISTLTDNGTGDYTLSYTSSFANGNYLANANGHVEFGVRTVHLLPDAGSYNTGSTRYGGVLNSDASLFDPTDA